MNTIKEFLKPNGYKLILFVAMVVVSIILVMVELQKAVAFGMFGDSSSLYQVSKFFWAPAVFLGNYIGVIALIILILYWYFLSCLIYFIFQKIKGLKKE